MTKNEFLERLTETVCKATYETIVVLKEIKDPYEIFRTGFKIGLAPTKFLENEMENHEND